MSRFALVAFVLFLCATISVASLVHLGPSPSAVDSDPSLAPDGALPAEGVFPGWRDDFTDTSKVAASSGVEFNGLDVRLPGPALNRQGLVVARGSGFDSSAVIPWSVLLEGTTFKMWYSGFSGGASAGGYATSADGRTWSKQGVVISPSLPQDSAFLGYADVIKVGTLYHMWYAGSDGSVFRILSATSPDGVSWTKQGVVLAPGPPGSPDDRFVWRPTVVYQAPTYHMWYCADSMATPARNSIFLATSTDGLSWTKQGVVLSPGPPGSLDDENVILPSVRLVAGRYRMFYSAWDGSVERLFSAESADGVVWQKEGVALDVLPPDEYPKVTHPALLANANGSWVYYSSHYPYYETFLATSPPAGTLRGWFRSLPVSIPRGLEWAWFNQSFQTPSGTWLNVTVRDGVSLAAVPGFDNVSSGTVDLRLVDPGTYPSLVFEGYFVGNRTTTPVLDSWDVQFRDASPPEFVGLESALDFGTGGAVLLGWSGAADPGSPVTYEIYQTRGSDAFDFSTPTYATQAQSFTVVGLVNGDLYRFVVRARDVWDNEDANEVAHGAIPTTPIDDTPPIFPGLASVQDSRIGGSVDLSWYPASDPDTPASNSDPSLPIVYLVYAVRGGTSFDFGSPALATQNGTARISGLTDGTPYDFLVRAMDAQGNIEANAGVRRAIPTHAYDATPPNFLGVDSVSDLGTGGGVHVAWQPATDPDTPESGVDPSLPVAYRVYVSENISSLGTGTPSATTEYISVDIQGLVPDRTYYVLVRAVDASSNEDANSRIVSFRIHPPPQFSAGVLLLPIVLMLIIAALLAALVVRRRRKRENTPPASPPGT